MLFIGSFASAQGATPSAPPAAPQLSPLESALAKIKAQDPMVRRQGAEELGRLRDPQGATVLTSLLKDSSAYVRSAAVDALGLMRLGGPQIAELLVNDPDAQVRTQAAISLTYLADPSTEDALIKATGDSAPGVRFAAIRTLGNMRSQKAVAPLIKFLDSPDVSNRQAAVTALERIGSRDSLDALKKASADSDPGVRQQAVRGLGAIGDPAAIETLKARLADPEMPVRVQAALALGRFGDASGLPLGLDLLSNPEPLLRQQGSQIIGQLGDEKVGLKALNAAYEQEQDPASKQMIDLARAQLKARLGIREKPPVAPTAPKAGPTAPKTAPAKPVETAPKKKVPAKPKKKAP